MKPPALVLGSTSPYRRELLARLGLAFEVDAPDVDEHALPGEAPDALVRRLAEAKARAVAARHPGALVIGSDQVAVLDGVILGKPGDHARAMQQLRAASGKTVLFQTGLCLFDDRNGSAQVDVVPFRVVFRTLSDAQIENYLRRERPYNCAGSFKSEGLGISLFQRLEGDDPNALIGLPLIRLVDMLAEAGVHLL
ncbi:MAG: Maf family nucleotide pyrophosphatase [Thiohalomonadaceae bacterium]